MNNSQKSKILPLESLRGIAALSVAVYHFDASSHFNNAFTDKSWLMVDFFFVLSGFVIALNYQSRLNSLKQLGSFQLKRFLRLYPLHVLMLSLFVGLELTKLVLVKYTGFGAMHAPFSGSRSVSSLLPNLLLMQNWIVANTSWNYPSWSISSEFFVYLIFGILTLLLRRWSAIFYLAAGLVIVASFALLVQHGMGTSNISGPLRCLYSFFLGVLLFNLFARTDIEVPSYVAVLAFIGSIAAVIFSKGQYHVSSLFIPLIFAVAIFAVSKCQTDSALVRLMSLKPLVYLGTISYGIYMIHAFVWYIIALVARIGFQVPFSEDLDGVLVPDFGSWIVSDGVVIFGLASIVVLSHFSYKFIEIPFNRMGRKKK